MFKKLQIKNFQSHKDTVIEFSENVTCITGLNNHGKSVLLRALYKVVRDEPDGISFITDTPKKEDQCEIILETDRGTVERIVKRNSSASGNNMYTVNDIEFSNFSKSGIPLEVQAVMEVSPPVEFGDLSIDLNFHNQFDAMFLMQGAGLASIRGKVVGKVTNIDEVQRAIQLGAAEEKQLKQETNRIQKDVEQNKLEQEKYADLPEQEELIVALEAQLVYEGNLSQKIENIKVKSEELKIIVNKAKTAQERIKLTSQDFSPNTFKALELVNKIKLLKEFLQISWAYIAYKRIASIELPTMHYDYLAGQRKRVVLILQLLNIKQQMYLASQNADIDLSSIDLQKLQDSNASLSYLKNSIGILNTYGEGLRNVSATVDQYKEDCVIVDNEFKQLKIELKICPTCQRSFV